MKLFCLTLLLTFTFSSSFNIDGMKCGRSCVNKIKTEMNNLDGVNNLDINFDKSVMTVDYDKSKLNDSQIISHLSENTSYSASIVDLSYEDNSSKSVFSKMLCGLSSFFGFCSK